MFAAVAESGTSRGDRRPIGVIGAALDLGSGRRGVDMGPSAIRYAQLGERIEAMGLPIHDHGNVRTGMVEALDQGDPSARYWSAIKRTCEELADHVAATVNDGEMTPVTPAAVTSSMSVPAVVVESWKVAIPSIWQ